MEFIPYIPELRDIGVSGFCERAGKEGAFMIRLVKCSTVPLWDSTQRMRGIGNYKIGL